MESRIILDTAGAEKLVGRGDMLYAPLGEGKPKRVQGCFISSEAVSYTHLVILVALFDELLERVGNEALLAIGAVVGHEL